MLDFEWGNPAAAAAAMMLFGEEAGQVDACQDRGGVFAHYGGGGGGMVGDFFPQPLAAAAPGLFPAGSPAAAGLGMGLNLGVRTYFSSAEAGVARHVAGRVCRRRTRTARCQAEGCGADLTHAKHYHRRHKVCEFHSKASIVIAAGLSQRFCQQCSRFHVLAEFDQGKRSCRKRLADHNRRRRKSQDLTTLTAAANSNNNTAAAVPENNEGPNKEKLGLFTTSSGSGSNNNNSNGPTSKPQLALVVCNPEGSSSVTDHVAASPQQPLMALGLGSGGGVVVSPAVTGLSASSSTGGTSPTSVSFLSHLGGFRWDDGEDAWKQH